MASKATPVNVDLNSVFEGAVSQFRSLNPNEPGQWPVLPKLLAWLAVAIAMVVLGWFTLLSSAHDEEATMSQQVLTEMFGLQLADRK